MSDTRSLRERCGHIGALAFQVYRFGNRTVYGNYPAPIRKLRMLAYQALDLIIVRAVASARLPAQTRVGERIGLVHDANGVILHPDVVIGDDVTIFHQVTIGKQTGEPKRPVIGNGVMIGAGAKILGNVTVSDYAMIGTNAVVLQDVPEGATAVGVPARIIPAKPDFERSPRR